MLNPNSLQVNDEVEVSVHDGLVRFTGPLDVEFPLDAASFHWRSPVGPAESGWGALTIVVGDEETRHTTLALQMSEAQAQRLHTFLRLAADPGQVH